MHLNGGNVGSMPRSKPLLYKQAEVTTVKRKLFTERPHRNSHYIAHIAAHLVSVLIAQFQLLQDTRFTTAQIQDSLM